AAQGSSQLPSAFCLLPTDALDHLEQLRECSLVLAEEVGERQPGGSEMRFRLLETLREFGWEAMGAAARAERERRHAEYLLGLAESAKGEVGGPEQPRWLERLEADHDNLRAALAWA